jgi:hypothetical protein
MGKPCASGAVVVTKKTKDENFEIPKTTRFLPLQDYDPKNAELAGVGIFVWVDPPRSVLAEFDKINGDYSEVLYKVAAKPGTLSVKKTVMVQLLLNWLRLLRKRVKDAQFKSISMTYLRKILAWYARIWSQSPDVGTHWTVGELAKINKKNPALFDWLCINSRVLIGQHQKDARERISETVSQYARTERTGAPAAGGKVISPRVFEGLPGEWLEAALAITARVAKAKKQDHISTRDHRTQGENDVH